jgi:hypothetical protein
LNSFFGLLYFPFCFVSFYLNFPSVLLFWFMYSGSRSTPSNLFILLTPTLHFRHLSS